MVERDPLRSPSAARVPRYLAAAGTTVDLDDDGFLLDLTFWGLPSPSTGCVTLEEAAASRCLVVLGEPGAGKSTVLETLSDSGGPPDAHHRLNLDLIACASDAWLTRRLFEAEEVKAWRMGGGMLELTLDSLDECRMNVPNVAIMLGGELGGWPTDRLRLRIGCRSADWPASLGETLGAMFPGTAILDLLPLRRRDVPAFAHAAGVDSEAFLAALSQVNAGQLASRPLGLQLMLRMFARTGGVGDNIVELYRGAVASMCEEQNRTRLDNRAPPVTTATARHAAACRLAACSVLGALPLVWTGPRSQSDDSDLVGRTCAMHPTPGPPPG